MQINIITVPTLPLNSKRDKSESEVTSKRLKLGAFDPYMNEYVLNSNEVLIPQIPVIRNCGYTLLQNNSTSVVAFDLDCTNVLRSR